MSNQQNFNSGESNSFSGSSEPINQNYSKDSTFGSGNYYQQSQPNMGFQNHTHQNSSYQGMGQQNIGQSQQQFYNNAYSQGNYVPAAGQQYSSYGQRPEEISVLQYLGMMWVTAIPVIGFILILIWAFSNDGINRRNYARAILINMAISILLILFSWGFFVTVLYQIINNAQYY